MHIHIITSPFLSVSNINMRLSRFVHIWIDCFAPDWFLLACVSCNVWMKFIFEMLGNSTLSQEKPWCKATCLYVVWVTCFQGGLADFFFSFFFFFQLVLRNRSKHGGKHHSVSKKRSFLFLITVQYVTFNNHVRFNIK